MIDVLGVTVRFQGIMALSDVSLSLRPGTILAVIGPNGSGKSTLFNSISGLVDLTEGSISIGGRDVHAVPPHGRVKLGLARTFQTPRFDAQKNVEFAVLCGFYSQFRAGPLGALIRLPHVGREERRLLDECHTILKDLQLFELRHTPLAELSMGQVRLVEVARAIASKPKYLLLDEPAAGLSRFEQQTLAGEVRRLRDQGVAVFLIEHNFSLVRDVAEHVVVLDRGKVVLEGAPELVKANPAFIDLYLGNTGRVM
jgi:ABC-type branched-subunit amino acid transport system ATPase component